MDKNNKNEPGFKITLEDMGDGFIGFVSRRMHYPCWSSRTTQFKPGDVVRVKHAGLHHAQGRAWPLVEVSDDVGRSEVWGAPEGSRSAQ